MFSIVNMHFQEGNLHYGDVEEIAARIERFNALETDEDIQDQDQDYIGASYEDEINSPGELASNYRKQQIDEAVSRINRQLRRMKKSSTGQTEEPMGEPVLPGNHRQRMKRFMGEIALSGSPRYAKGYLKDMEARVRHRCSGGSRRHRRPEPQEEEDSSEM